MVGQEVINRRITEVESLLECTVLLGVCMCVKTDAQRVRT